MCEDVSVARWLDGLRQAVEYYEPFDERNLTPSVSANHEPDEKLRERDVKFEQLREPCVKSSELDVKLRERGAKSPELDVKLRERCVKSSEPDAKLRERDVKFEQLREPCVKSSGLDVKLRERCVKSSKPDAKLRERDVKIEQLREPCVKSSELDVKSRERGAKSPIPYEELRERCVKLPEPDELHELCVKSPEPDAKLRELCVKSPELDVKLRERCEKSPETDAKLSERCVKFELDAELRERSVKSTVRCVKSPVRDVKSWGGEEVDARSWPALSPNFALDVKFALERTVSADFDDRVEPLGLSRVVLVGGGEEPADVMLWRERIREECCEEEQDMLESQEVLRNLQSNRDDPVSRGIGPFPKHDDFKCPEDEIQIRHHSNSTKSRQSKTVDYDFRRKSPPKTPDFQVIGCTKIHLPNEQSMMKLKKNEEYILYQNNVIYKVDSSKSQLPLKFGVIFKSARSLNKKEVELRDSNNQVYLFIFDSSKDAKNFTENDNLACLFDSEKSTITKTLLRLLGKRSSREVLEKKGIYQNETVFGNTLAHIYKLEKGVPSFILKVIELIERPDNITSVGLYRTSGNLATIQKIRLEVDKGNPGVLDNYAKDPDVLTGSLKLFFRELKEPLVSCQTCDNLSSLARSDKTYYKKDKDKVRTILKHLPEANSSTLLVLIRHLIEVVKYKDHNKMDTYNLAVCWGPTLIFATGASGSSKDPVTQSAEATRLFDALLSFYIDHPEEMELRTGGGRGWLDANMNAIQRGDSRESVVSGGEGGGGSKLQKKSSSNLSIEMIDEGLRKAVELIENVIKTNGLYKKSGSLERTNKIVKKMTKKKIAEMEKYKNDVHELTDSLKKYMREVHEPLVTKEVVDHINKICDNGRCPDDPAARRLISTIISDLPQRHSLLFLVRHLAKVIDHEPAHHVPKSDILAVWASVLSDRMVVDSEERYAAFLAAMVDVFGGEEVRGEVRGMPDGLLDDLRSAQREKDRVSRYDNVPDVEGKTDEHTKL